MTNSTVFNSLTTEYGYSSSKDGQPPTILNQVSYCLQFCSLGKTTIMRIITCVFFLLSLPTVTWAQVEINSTVSAEIYVCTGSGSMAIELVNNTSTALTGPKVTVKLPQGIQYQSNSLTETTSYNVQEDNVSSDTALTFSMNSIGSGDTVLFEIKFEAGVLAVTAQQGGLIFRNNVLLSHSTDTISIWTSSFNILYPVLAILSVSPNQTTIVSGTSTTRTISLINGGNGKLTSFFLVHDINSSELTIDSIDQGILSNDTFFLDGSDFSNWGNGDIYWDQNESIDILEYITGSSCQDITVTSIFSAFWGCDGNFLSSSAVVANLTIDSENPQLNVSTTDSIGSCFSSGIAHPQQLRLINTGAGVASIPTVLIYKASNTTEDHSIYSRIDDSSLVYKVGISGTEISITTITRTATTSTGGYSCLGSNPIGKVEFTLPQINPGDTVYIYWDMYSCCVQQCQNEAITGWATKVTYQNLCGNKNYSTTVSGQSKNQQYVTFTSETPIDLLNNQTLAYTYIVSSFKNTLPSGPGAFYTSQIDLPAGVVFDSIRFHQNDVEWQALSVEYDTTINRVTATYDDDAPFVIPKSEITLLLRGVCGSSGWKTINFSFSYTADTGCLTTCAIPLECDYETTTYLHCPASNCTGISVTGYYLQRQNTGSPDNNMDGKADGSGSVDLTKIKLNRVMVGDTIMSQATTFITGTGSYDYAKYTSDIDYGNYVEIQTATLRFYDSSSATHYDIDGITSTKSVSSNAAEFEFDLSMSVLITLNSSLTGLSFEHGDSLIFSIQYVVTGSVPGLIQETTFLNEFYVSTVSSPTSAQKENCNVRNGRLTLIGYAWRNDYKNKVSLKSCTKNIHQYFGMSIGSIGNNYGGGNLFPFEYRNFGTPKSIKVLVPSGYNASSATLYYYRTRKTNSTSSTKIQNIQPDTIIGDTLFYDVYKYIIDGTILVSDDGFHGRLIVAMGANCDRLKNTYEDIDWYFDYYKVDRLGGGQTSFIEATNSDEIRYVPAILSLLSNNPTVNSDTRLIEWDLKVKNTTSSQSENAWVLFQAPSYMTIDSVKDDQTNELVTPVNGFYMMGDISSNKQKDLTVYASITTCTNEKLTAITGFSCDGYPSSLSSYTCDTQQIQLGLIPRISAFQGRISSKLMSDPCLPLAELTVHITSVNIAHVFDMQIDFITPDTSKIKILDSTSSYARLGDTVAIAIPPFSNGTYAYAINDYDTTLIKAGIPGVLSIPNNTYTLTAMLEMGSAYVFGDYLGITITGNNVCADSLPDLNLAYDLNSKFNKDETAGLHLDIGNSWSASWGDYDNDGYDDLFVPINDLNKPNLLYHNNGDGSFTKITTGALFDYYGSSIAGVWGDYDNDGYIDLFVANNVNSENKLYHNNGDGTFTSISNSPIVDKGIYTHAAAWSDYNRDGNLDLVISDFHPTHFNFLFLGDGQGGFTIDTKSEVGMYATSAVGIAWGDYDNDGDQDLFIANTHGEDNQLFQNQEGVLRAIKTGPVVSDSGHSVGGTWGDYDNDGDLDLFVTNARNSEPNYFYENNGNGTFSKITDSEIVLYSSNSHGASWVDYDNDGYLDLMVANDQNMPNFLFRNNGDKTFTKIHNAITQENGNAYGTAWADYDNDGDYDLVVANRGDNTNDFFINSKGSCTNHIVVKLTGCQSNKSGIGAFIKVKSTIGGKTFWQTKEVATQNSAMGGQNSSKILFGLGTATSVDSLLVIWPSGIRTTIVNPGINSLHTITEQCGSQVCGTVFHDTNGNEVQDSNELGIPNAHLIVTPGNTNVYTDANGTYVFYSGDDTITITQVSNADWLQQYPANDSGYTLVIDKETQSVYCGNNFGDSAVCPNPDFSVLLGTTAMRRGLQNKLQVQITNSGAFAANDTVFLDIRTKLNTCLTDSLWNSSSEDSLYRFYTYKISTFQGLSDTTLTLVDSVDVNSSLNDTVSILATIRYSGGECDSGNNSNSYEDIIVGSIDPNDKHVFVDQCQHPDNAEGLSEEAERLVYKIRFQNLGNYAARRVEIIDSLSDHLDWNTFQVEASSHPFSVSVKHGIAYWINEQIELPDSFNDAEGSKGYVSFSIMPKPSIRPYTLIPNTGLIQFDRNAFIATNKTRVYVGLCALKKRKSSLIIFPNPATDYLEVLLMNDKQLPEEISQLSIISTAGVQVVSKTVNMVRSTVNTSHISPGMYTIKVMSKSGKVLSKKLIIL